MGLSRIWRRLALLGLLSAALVADATNTTATASNHTTVLILGTGMAGIIAARTLHEQGIDFIIILEATFALGGRMIPKAFGVTGRQVVVEMGPNWIQGTQEGSGTANPIRELALKHNLTTVSNDYGSIPTYDYNGYNNRDYSDTLSGSVDRFTQPTVVAGQRMFDKEVDMSLQSAYGMMGISPKTPQEVACDYYQIDWTSWLAAAWNNNFTYVPQADGYSDVNMMSIDQRGFVYIVEAEAAEFLHWKPRPIIYNETINLIEIARILSATTTGGMTFTADHVLCTFSAGVLQNADVVFRPSLPAWKVEAINSIEMIFMQFDDTFWFTTEVKFRLMLRRGCLANFAVDGAVRGPARGTYPVWQSLDHVGFFPGSGVMFVTVTGDWSLYIEQLPLAQVQVEVMEVLRAMYPNIDVPDPIAIDMPTWAFNTLYRGSYSNWGPSYIQAHSDNLRATVDNRLRFTGEATSLEYFGVFLVGMFIRGEI
ncbi:hypothetical protein BU15DRAFT_75279 [Melanogaster broomeanus]|nr:hypothetical protein BU15DRAFT_75279 [Melanogaster broomeanus]